MRVFAEIAILEDHDLFYKLCAMPTYEYFCEKCDHQFDIFQSMTEKTLTQCPKDKCGQKKWGKGRVKRGVGGGAGLIFKGSGFYITDYRSESYKAGAKSDSASASPASSTPSSDGAKSTTPAAAAPATAAPAKTSATSAKPAKSEPKSQ